MPRGYGETPVRSFRIPDDVMLAASNRADEEDIPLNAVIVHALRRYAAGAKVNLTPPPRGA